MILVLTVTEELLTAAVHPTGRSIHITDYHNLLATVVQLEKQQEKTGKYLAGIVAMMGSVSFTRHRQTITLINAFAALRSIPAIAVVYSATASIDEQVQQALGQLHNRKTGSVLTPEYRAAPTITMKK